MENLQTVIPVREESTFPAHAEQIISSLKEEELSDWSGKQMESLPTAAHSETSLRVPRHAIATPTSPIKGDFRLLQMWEGCVLSIDVDHNEFTVQISDKMNKDLPDEQLTLSIDEISPNDLVLLKEGAVFYWSIGYADYPGRPRTRESRIRFRRLPKWTNRELQNARERGAELAGIFSSN